MDDGSYTSGASPLLAAEDDTRRAWTLASIAPRLVMPRASFGSHSPRRRPDTTAPRANSLSDVERSPLLPTAIGGAAFAVLYFASLVLSDAGTYLKHRHDPAYASLGASGAISAVLFANIVYFPTQSLFIFPIPIPIPAPVFAVGYVAYTWYSSRQARGRINHDAHLGGALFGLLFVLLTDPGAYGALSRIFAG